MWAIQLCAVLGQKFQQRPIEFLGLLDVAIDLNRLRDVEDMRTLDYPKPL